MPTAVATDAQSLQLVAFALGEEEYGIPITLVQEILRHTPPRPIPGTPTHVEGVINLRGRIIPVVDLKRCLGILGDLTPDATIVIVQLGEATVGVIVDEVREVITISADATEAAPSGIASACAGYIESVAKLEGRILVILDLAQLLGEASVR